MNTQKAAYWLALAIFGFALHSEYQRGAFPLLRRAADCACTRACRMVAHARQFVAVAKVLIDDPWLRPGDLPAKVEVSNWADASDWAAGNWMENRRHARSELRQQARDRAEIARQQVRAQLRIMRSQLEIERAQGQQARLCEQARIAVNQANQRIVVMCPKSGLTLTVDNRSGLRGPDPELSDMDAGDWFSGDRF